jgi:hypothetical protein
LHLGFSVADFVVHKKNIRATIRRVKLWRAELWYFDVDFLEVVDLAVKTSALAVPIGNEAKTR